MSLFLFMLRTFLRRNYFPHIEKIKKVGYDGVEIPIGDGDAKDYRKVGEFLKYEHVQLNLHIFE